MKLFVCALIVLSLIAGMCVFGTVRCNRIIDGLFDDLGDEPKQPEIPTDAAERSKKLLANWEENFFVISMFLPHHHLDEIKEKMVALDSYASTDEFAEWKEARNVLAESLQHIRSLMQANADNIL